MRKWIREVQKSETQPNEFFWLVETSGAVDVGGIYLGDVCKSMFEPDAKKPWRGFSESGHNTGTFATAWGAASALLDIMEGRA